MFPILKIRHVLNLLLTEYQLIFTYVSGILFGLNRDETIGLYIYIGA